MGMSGNSPVALAYAAQHPERVTRLIMYGGWAGWPHQSERADDDDTDEAAFQALVRAGWAKPDPIFRRVFTNIFIPDATERQMSWFDDLQRMSTSTENMLAARQARRETNVSDLLPDVRVPTLVLHARGDTAVSFEHARSLAARLPDARLTALESRNHILLADEPAWGVFRQEVATFMEPDRAIAGTGADADVAALSAREREILHLAADGLSNDEIAERLTLSVRTVERHLSNAYLKLGITGKAARTAAVARLLRRPD